VFHKSLNLSLLLCVLCTCSITVASAQEEHFVPAGFEDLNKAHESIIDVYQAGKFIGSYPARYTPEAIKFDNPAVIVSKINNIQAKDRRLIIDSLSGDLKTNADLICSAFQRQECGILKPDNAGVIFNEKKLRTDIFINPHFLQQKDVSSLSLLPKSTSGLSVSNFINGSTQGTDQTKSYNVYTNSILAYENFHINSNISYSHQSIKNQSDQTNWLVNNLNTGLTVNNYELDAGAIQTAGDLFLPGQSILGVSATTSLNRYAQNSDVFGTPIILFLPFPSKVSIYSDNKLLSSNFYPAGRQKINTENLPTGAYEITLKTEAENGSVSQETQFFSKTTRIPPLHHPQYGFQVGYLQDRYGNNTFQHYSNNLLLSAQVSTRLTKYWGINSTMLTLPKHNYLSLGSFFVTSCDSYCIIYWHNWCYLCY
jgi:outer membrane usher protein FimD/PapC